ncbi:multicopper oxidase family protein [Gracilibacillus alcaliphilus]|uniref:multicopper oxidase family protein n=1 Tax=Gracilibacillus alcaliphilus TaxID=1401441 RepID=UPI00195CED49|nr:multicopper oxidase domain-containing protein [Gracilibacillus alcaliphilus]MBM7675333.1 spore coat protein A [Gracilibacillus alcaliphilus]
MSPKLEKFVDPLPRMEVLKPNKKTKDGAHYEITMRQFRSKLHRDLPATTLWGYNGQFPGPIIEANRDEPVHVTWLNQLPDRHLLPVDLSIHGLEQLPAVRTVVHLHGIETKPESDGHPEAWYTRNFQETGPFFSRETYTYPNYQRGSLLWYHDHAMGITRLNVYAGLAGMYILRDKQEKSLNLPAGDYEIPLMIADRSFQADGSLFYPSQPADAAANLPNPSVLPAFNGDTILVNGKAWPFLEVEPRKYRFRILNASNTRSYQLQLDSHLLFQQIGSDGGLLRNTVKMERISLQPAERVDLIIDFSKAAGQSIVLKNEIGTNEDTGNMMQFRVTKPLKNKDRSLLPSALSVIPSLKQNKISAIRYLKLVGTADEFDRPLLLLNNKHWHDPVTENPRLGATEIWALTNTTNFSHPIHIHLIQFQVLDHQPFDLEQYNIDGKIVYTGPPKAPPANHRGWKDTIEVPAANITRVIAKFAPYSGEFVWHCHILEHEDYDMMRPYVVVDDDEKDEKQS